MAILKWLVGALLGPLADLIRGLVQDWRQERLLREAGASEAYRRAVRNDNRRERKADAAARRVVRSSRARSMLRDLTTRRPDR